MNTRLERLFDTYEFSHKDRKDFLSIYNLLPSHKKARAVDNFDSIASELWLLHSKLITEQEILFWKALWNIEEKISAMKRQKMSRVTKQDIAILKNTL